MTSCTRRLLTPSILCLLASLPASALPTQLPANVPTHETAVVRTDLRDKLSLHGYLSFAWGQTDGHTYRGITGKGTADLHNAALQIRFAPTTHDDVVLQLANESVGTSPTNELRDDLEIDWLFYRRQLGESTNVRIGRVPLPIGIYNEVKDVGTLLPFYRPSGNFYGEGTWTSDSVDGIVVSHAFAADRRWSVDLDAYYGSWERIETDGSTLRFDVADIDDAVGFYLWLNTPWRSVRIGVGANRFDSAGGVFLPPGVTDREETRYLSLDGDFDRFVVRSEYSERTFTGGTWQAYYAEVVYRLTDAVKLMANFDTGVLDYTIPNFASFDDAIEESVGIGASFALRPNLVFKAEYSWVTGYGQIEDVPLNIFFDEPVDTNYLLLSVSTHF